MKTIAIYTIPNRMITAGEYNAAYGHNVSHMTIFEQYVKLPKSATMWTVFTGSNIEVNIEYTGKTLGKRNMESINDFIQHGFILEANVNGVELIEKPAPTIEAAPEPPDDDELSLEDIAAIESAMTQPDMEPVTVEELSRLVEQNQQKLIGRITRLKAQARAMGHDWGNVISHAVPYALRTYSDERLNHLHLDYIEKYLSQPVCFKCEHIHTNKECPRCHKPLCSYCEWGTLDRHINACPECALVLRKEQEALQQAWNALQSVPAYTARFARENVQVG